MESFQEQIHPNGPQHTRPQHLLMSLFLGNNDGWSSVTGIEKTERILKGTVSKYNIGVLNLHLKCRNDQNMVTLLSIFQK